MRISDWSSDVCSSDLKNRQIDWVALSSQRRGSNILINRKYVQHISDHDMVWQTDSFAALTLMMISSVPSPLIVASAPGSTITVATSCMMMAGPAICCCASRDSKLKTGVSNHLSWTYTRTLSIGVGPAVPTSMDWLRL